VSGWAHSVGWPALARSGRWRAPRRAPRWEAALAENAAVDILGDDLAALADEDGAPGGRAEALIAELQSFTDLAHSKGRRVAALQWLPHRKVRPAPRSWRALGLQFLCERPWRAGWRAALLASAQALQERCPWPEVCISRCVQHCLQMNVQIHVRLTAHWY
jgi:hypothetical protein